MALKFAYTQTCAASKYKFTTLYKPIAISFDNVLGRSLEVIVSDKLYCKFEGILFHFYCTVWQASLKQDWGFKMPNSDGNDNVPVITEEDYPELADPERWRPALDDRGNFDLKIIAILLCT